MQQWSNQFAPLDHYHYIWPPVLLYDHVCMSEMLHGLPTMGGTTLLLAIAADPLVKFYNFGLDLLRHSLLTVIRCINETD